MIRETRRYHSPKSRGDSVMTVHLYNHFSSSLSVTRQKRKETCKGRREREGQFFLQKTRTPSISVGGADDKREERRASSFCPTNTPEENRLHNSQIHHEQLLTDYLSQPNKVTVKGCQTMISPSELTSKIVRKWSEQFLKEKERPLT